MPWIAVDVAIAVVGLVVLALFAVRLWGQVKQLGREVSDASQRISAAVEELGRNTPPPR